jgi:hypothetical protein
MLSFPFQCLHLEVRALLVTKMNLFCDKESGPSVPQTSTMPVIGIHSREPSAWVRGLLLWGKDLNVDNTRLATLPANFDIVSLNCVVRSSERSRHNEVNTDLGIEPHGSSWRDTVQTAYQP